MGKVDDAGDLLRFIELKKQKFFYVNGNSVCCIIRNLKFLYCSVVASENLLVCAVRQLKLMNSNGYRNEIIAYYREHLKEESGHAKWLADDLAAHGVFVTEHDSDAVRMIGSQYYMIFHESPYCLLGYMAVVEGVPTPLAEIEKLEKIYGTKLFRFSRFHAVKDMEHRKDIFKHIGDADALLAKKIEHSAIVTLEHIESASKNWR